MAWKSIMFYYSLMDLKGHFNRDHVTKVNSETFARGYKKRIQQGKALHRFPDFINRIYFTLIFKVMVLTALVNFAAGMEVSQN